MIYSGKDGAFLVAGVERSCKVVDVEFSNAIQSTNRFQSRGKQTNVKGFDKLTFTAKGPYDAGNYGLICGEEYVFGHVVGGAVNYGTLCRITSLRLTNDAEGKPELEIKAESDGEFNPLIL